ncbi:helix-turn-helix domain-containing protein [Nocardioides sp. KR10-350]|uniref:helix-turn-helix domain-containing protein n=1 Tax=Nocardioides cheoyonin TaxID=3156615 RepID=UPI0032B4CAFB
MTISTQQATTGAAEPKEGHSRLLTLEEAADRLRISRWGLRQLINDRELVTVQIGRRRLVTEADLDALIASRRQGGRDDI